VSIEGYDEFVFSDSGIAHPVYRRGSGPGVAVIHELPGMSAACIGLANEIAGHGFSVYLPLLFGKPGDWNTTIGTTLVVKGVTTKEIEDPGGALYCHRHPEGYWMPGGASNTGADWVSKLFGDRVEQLNKEAFALIPTRYLTWPLMQEGERFPFASPQARGFFPEGLPDATLFALIDQCVTAMGSRQLRRWLNRPLTDQPTLRSRYQALSALIDGRNFEGVREHLHGIGDIERILARVALRSARPRDLTQLRRSLALLPALRAGLEPIDSPLLQELRARVEEHDDVVKLLTAAIAEEPSTFVRDGGVIAEGYDADLDELRRIATHTDEFLLELERRERERTGIAGLKLGYNRVSGFFIEITRKDAERVPKDYIRRQTVKSAERFITEELKGFEEKVLSARDRSLAREKDLYETILTQLIDRLGPMQASGMALSELDALASLAERACTLEWSRPDLVSESRISIECGRHPIVQRFSTSPFVPNDLRFDSGRNMLIITGPNMGGKSTYMRQAALIVLLAHIGSHVPADRATIGPLDRIFTRIGAADDLAGGRSTFMVEMTEAANILHNATAHSLILMDEIGRGTSTFDGLSLAWAMAHHIATRLKSFTLFATHYFELTTLATEVEGCVNVHLDATEHGDGIVFLHAVKEGPANRSYGLQVAQLAGVPREVITQARHYLEALESQRDQHDAAAADRHSTQRDLFAAAPARAPKSPAPADPLRTAMEAIDPDELSPKAALETLYRLRKLLKSGGEA